LGNFYAQKKSHFLTKIRIKLVKNTPFLPTDTHETPFPALKNSTFETDFSQETPKNAKKGVQKKSWYYINT
jgi:hypothetical protein